jgi:hypothetical protein
MISLKDVTKHGAWKINTASGVKVFKLVGVIKTTWEAYELCDRVKQCYAETSLPYIEPFHGISIYRNECYT